jgi:ABC-type uncharacterized transport system substrate-binding protein
MPPRSLYALVAGAVLVGAIGAWRAEAHPHVWITVQTTVLHENGAFTGLRHRWTFDEFYSAMEVEGLDKNKDGKFDREELAELAGFYVSGLKDFSYFTFPVLGGQKLKLGEPNGIWLEYSDSLLSLNFQLPFDQPVLADARGFAFSVYDPSFYIALDMDKPGSIRLADTAPKDCKVSLDVQAKDAANTAALNEAFSSQLGGGMGLSAGKAASVICEVVVASAAKKPADIKTAPAEKKESADAPAPKKEAGETKAVEQTKKEAVIATAPTKGDRVTEAAPREIRKDDVADSRSGEPKTGVVASVAGTPKTVLAPETLRERTATQTTKTQTKKAKPKRKKAKAKRRVAPTSWWDYSCGPERMHTRHRTFAR